MRWKLVSLAMVALLAMVAVEGCGGGGKKKKRSSANRTTPKDALAVQWVKVPGGKFKLGDKKYENFKVGTYNIGDFEIMKYEVTNHQYKLWIDTLTEELREEHTPRPDPITGKGGWTDGWYKEGMHNYPVTNIDLGSAVAYAKANAWKLPERIKWEVAARGPDSRIFPWGDTFDKSRANFDNRAEGVKPVGGYENGKSWCGAYDMGGNVWEWTTSYFEKGRSPFRLVKGGSFLDNVPDNLEGANSMSVEPSKKDITIGFRCIRD